MFTHSYPEPKFDFDEDDFYDDFESLKDRVEEQIIEPYEAGAKITKYVEDGELVAVIIDGVSVSLSDWQVFRDLYEDTDEDFQLKWRITGMTAWQTQFELIRD